MFNAEQFSGDSDSDDDNFTSLQIAQSNNTEIMMRNEDGKEKNVRNELDEHIYSSMLNSIFINL